MEFIPVFFLTVWIGIYVYAALHTDLHQGRHDNKAGIMAERYRTFCTGDCNVSCCQNRYWSQVPCVGIFCNLTFHSIF